MPRLSLYWHTLRYLKPVQFYGRLWFRLYYPRPDLRPAPPRRIQTGIYVEPCHRSPTLIGPNQFIFLNEPGRVTSAADWSDPDKSTLWLYNLHYFDDLNATSSEDRTEWHRALLYRWITENSVGKGVGWDPYPISLRVVNWIKWVLSGHDMAIEMSWSLALQVRWLRRRLEYHLLGNHLLANAKAMVFAGLFFGGTEAEDWYEDGIKLLSCELHEQILSDGGHFERSPMYHLIALEDLLDVINLHRTYDMDYPQNWDGLAGQMLEWSRIMRHPDGDIPFFNDAAFGIAPSPALLDDYAGRLGLMPGMSSKLMAYHLAESGYARLEAGDAVLLVDLAPVGPDYLPGHAHADTLAFELSLDTRRVVVNGGTSVYGTGEERLRQRSTAAHAALLVDGQNSSEVWSGFRVARRAHVIESNVWRDHDSCNAVGVHDGYRRLSGKPLHRRTWTLRATDLRVTDELLGAGTHRADIIYPLAPGLRPNIRGNGCIEIVDEKDGCKVLVLHSGGGAEIVVERSSWHPRFGITIKTWQIRIQLQGKLPLSHETVLRWSN
jgi:uncharacterized heparinase superfamily protein